MDKVEFDLRYGRMISPEPNTGCLLWLGRVDKDGYAPVKYQKKNRRLHRLAYEAFVEPIPEGMVIDHICHVRCCQNPAHMRVTTAPDNASRKMWIPAHIGKYRLANTNCPHGHPYSGDNLRIAPSGQRVCRACLREAMRKKRKPRNEAKAAALAARTKIITDMILAGHSMLEIGREVNLSVSTLRRNFKCRKMRKRIKSSAGLSGPGALAGR